MACLGIHRLTSLFSISLQWVFDRFCCKANNFAAAADSRAIMQLVTAAICMQVLIPHKTDVKIESMVVSQSHLVVFQRIKGLQV